MLSTSRHILETAQDVCRTNAMSCLQALTQAYDAIQGDASPEAQSLRLQMRRFMEAHLYDFPDPKEENMRRILRSFKTSELLSQSTPSNDRFFVDLILAMPFGLLTLLEEPEFVSEPVLLRACESAREERGYYFAPGQDSSISAFIEATLCFEHTVHRLSWVQWHARRVLPRSSTLEIWQIRNVGPATHRLLLDEFMRGLRNLPVGGPRIKEIYIVYWLAVRLNDLDVLTRLVPRRDSDLTDPDLLKMALRDESVDVLPLLIAHTSMDPSELAATLPGMAVSPLVKRAAVRGRVWVEEEIQNMFRGGLSLCQTTFLMFLLQDTDQRHFEAMHKVLDELAHLEPRRIKLQFHADVTRRGEEPFSGSVRELARRGLDPNGRKTLTLSTTLDGTPIAIRSIHRETHKELKIVAANATDSSARPLIYKDYTMRFEDSTACVEFLRSACATKSTPMPLSLVHLLDLFSFDMTYSTGDQKRFIQCVDAGIRAEIEDLSKTLKDLKAEVAFTFTSCAMDPEGQSLAPLNAYFYAYSKEAYEHFLFQASAILATQTISLLGADVARVLLAKPWIMDKVLETRSYDRVMPLLLSCKNDPAVIALARERGTDFVYSQATTTMTPSMIASMRQIFPELVDERERQEIQRRELDRQGPDDKNCQIM